MYNIIYDAEHSNHKFELPLPNLCEPFSHIIIVMFAKVMNYDSVRAHNHFTDSFLFE